MTNVKKRSQIFALGLGVTAICIPIASLGQDVGAGAYLAARQASILADYNQATTYYKEAIPNAPQNLSMLENAMVAYIGKGDVNTAASVAEKFEAAGGSNQISDLVLNTVLMAEGNFMRTANQNTGDAGLAPLLGGLMKGWALLGDGKMSEATKVFNQIAEADDLANFAYYHQALAFALVGDFQAADEILSGAKYGALSLSLREIEAHAQILVQLERQDDAIALLDVAMQRGFSAELSYLRNQIADGNRVPFYFVTSAKDGAAEVLFSLSSLLNGRASAETVLIYARMAQHLNPDHVPAILLIADALEQLQQYDLATQAYAKVPTDHPSYFLAEMGRADALYTDERKDAAVEVLTALSKSHGDIYMVHAALGDMLSRERRNEDAIVAFTKSLELRFADDPTTWRVYYARGIVHERLKDLGAMETDFRKALELSPNQPDVLNYLGYSLVEQRIKLDEALRMIQTAATERPESGYIIDSLGWIYYRLGRYDEAVSPMEQAVSLLPIDPIVNDHLGDVYWKVGRLREAEFQWKRALSFEPEEAEAERILRKLAVGLDKVLEEEADTGETQTANE